LRTRHLGNGFVAVRFGHEDETNYDKGSNDQDHQEKDLPSRGFVQVTVMGLSDHESRMRLREKEIFAGPGMGSVTAGRRERRWICRWCLAGRDE
jgi:hypothetical protein